MSTFARDSYGAVAPVMRPGRSSNVSIGATHNLSPAFESGTTFVRILASVDCYLAIGPNAEATVASTPIKAGVAEYFGVLPNDRVSVLRAAGDGVLNVTEASNFIPT